LKESWTAALLLIVGLAAILALWLWVLRPPPRPPEEIRAARGSLKLVVCFGDSLTAHGGLGGRYSDFLARALPGVEIVNRGISGDTLEGGRRRFDRETLALAPDVVIVELGANDFVRMQRPLSELREDLEYLLAAARKNGAQVIVAGVLGKTKPGYRDELGTQFTDEQKAFGAEILEMEREVCAQYGAAHIDNIQDDLTLPEHWADKRHPNAAGNELVAKLILPYLKDALGVQHAKAQP